MAHLSKDKVVTLEERVIADSEKQNTEGIMGKHKNVIRLLILILLALLVVIGIIVIIMLHNIYSTYDHTSDHTTTESSNYNANYLEDTITEPSDKEDDSLVGRLKDRNEWLGRPPISYINISHPVPMVIIKHTGGGFCTTFITCAGKVQIIQSQCVSDGLPDIRYNFLIGGDGNIYVGRGWNVQPAERNDTIDIAYIGAYSFDKLNPRMIEATKLLLDDGVSKKKLSEDYIVVAHNQTRPTEGPGANVYKEIVTWPHYDGRMYFVNSLVARHAT